MTMVVRRQADYMLALDERILEYLRGTPWAVPKEIVALPNVNATENIVRERFRWLATIDFLEYSFGEEREMVEITTDGILYLEGRVDAQLREPTKRALRG